MDNRTLCDYSGFFFSEFNAFNIFILITYLMHWILNVLAFYLLPYHPHHPLLIRPKPSYNRMLIFQNLSDRPWLPILPAYFFLYSNYNVSLTLKSSSSNYYLFNFLFFFFLFYYVNGKVPFSHLLSPPLYHFLFYDLFLSLS